MRCDIAAILITENGIVGADGITQSNRLILAQFCLNAYEQLIAQGQPPQYQAAYEPRQPEQNGVTEPEAQQAE